jgi:hypothetical protein
MLLIQRLLVKGVNELPERLCVEIEELNKPVVGLKVIWR